LKSVNSELSDSSKAVVKAKIVPWSPSLGHICFALFSIIESISFFAILHRFHTEKTNQRKQ